MGRDFPQAGCGWNFPFKKRDELRGDAEGLTPAIFDNPAHFGPARQHLRCKAGDRNAEPAAAEGHRIEHMIRCGQRY